MTYSGEVRPGGHPDVRTLPGLTVSKLAVGQMSNNAYLLTCPDTGEQLLIDAADEAGRLLDLAGPAGLTTIVTTHRHADHWQALTEVVRATGAQSLVHESDAPGVPTVSATVREGATVTVGSVALEVIHLVGHTPGSIALLYQDPAGHPHLFTGDSLFPGGAGRTTHPADFKRLMDDLEEKIFGRLPDDTWFYPGHGNDSTLGKERPALPEWRARGW